MSIRTSVCRVVLSAMIFVSASGTNSFGQTPSPAENFNDSIGIFRQTTTSDWPALFLSPSPYSQTGSLYGLTISIDKDEFANWMATTFSMNGEIGDFYWSTGSGSFMSFSNFGVLQLFDENGDYIEINPADGFIRIGDSAVLTETNAAPILSGSFLPLHPSTFNFSSSSASAPNSFAAGLGTLAQAANQFVIGQYNTQSGTTTEPTDPLFIVGNGGSATERSNAFVVNRNGDTKISGRLIQGTGAIALGQGASAIGFESYAYGNGAVAIGTYAMAIGSDSFAVGSGSIAEGGGGIAIGPLAYAGGAASIAFGTDSIAHGIYSVAFPSCSTVAWYSTALGSGAHASGFGSTAIGRSTIAQGLNQLAVGQFNVASGNSHNDPSESNAWDPANEIFIVGNGQNDSSRSNALTVKKNAATGIGTGVVTTTASQTVVGKYNDTSTDSEGRNRGAGLFVIGMGTGNQPAQRKNALRVREDGTLLVRPAGDILMGDFQSGEQP